MFKAINWRKLLLWVNGNEQFFRNLDRLRKARNFLVHTIQTVPRAPITYNRYSFHYWNLKTKAKWIEIHNYALKTLYKKLYSISPRLWTWHPKFQRHHLTCPGVKFKHLEIAIQREWRNWKVHLAHHWAKTEFWQ